MSSPLMSIDVDTAPLERAFDQLVEATRRRTLDACRTTAERIVRDAKMRLLRAGHYRSGETYASIEAVPAYDGNGYAVLSDNEDIPNLPLWIEKGTRAGKRQNHARIPASPYFYPAIETEVGPHEQRILEAMQDAGSLSGLGT